MNTLRTSLLPVVVLMGLLGLAAGCGKAPSPPADPQPFRAAIARYLEGNNMAMTVKEIKAGPIVEGQTATLTASLTHATLSGPAVTWQFRFQRNPDGTWKAVNHK